MAGTFAGLIADPKATKVYLVEIEAGIPLTDWNREDIGGTYFVIFAEKIINAIPTITSLEEDGTALTEVASYASCTAASGTWFQEDPGETVWDSASTTWDSGWTKWDEHGTLHVHTSDNTSANDKTIVAFVDLHFSNYPKIFNEDYYFPRLSKASIPTVSASTKDIFFGKTSVGRGNLIFNNGDGFFDVIHRRYAWKGNTVVVKLGGDYESNELTYATYQDQFTGIIDSNYYSDNDYRLDLIDIRADFHQTLPLNEALPATYANMDDSKKGASLPLIWGDVHNVTPILIDDTDQKGKYKIADDADKVGDTLFAIDAVYNDGVAIGAGDLTKDCAAGEFTIKNTYAGTPDVVTCDVQGRKDDGAGTITGSANAIIDRPAYIIKDICISLLGKAATDFDTTSYNNAVSGADYELAVCLGERINSSDVVEKICNSVTGLRFVIGGDGKIYLIYPSGEIAAGTPELIDEDIINFRTEGKSDDIYWKIAVKYDQDPTNDTWLIETQSENSVKYKFKRAENREIETYLKQTADATTMALRWLNITKVIPDHFYITTPLKPTNIKIGEQVKLTRTRAPVRAGELNESVYRVLAVAKDFNKALTKLELTSDVDILGIDACNTVCQIYCEQHCQSGCQGECQESCEITCRGTCEQACQKVCRLNCRSGCENTCQASCEGVCRSYCESNCQSTCELTCEGGCEATCEDTCEGGCLNQCQQNCQGVCQQNCQSGCLQQCQTGCEGTCQNTCLSGCLTGCEVNCQNTCETSCRTTCETDCMDACEIKCQSVDQAPEG